ncbi:hypothetical protein NEIELOOT_00701 [Neisseria elongata subsp. glycolytica ATCC 29315]|uniref:Uncharacterized protein n=1 Tax=Neisseria elongata subsp. glycolytica ATCC 29315 TaxID=546263 RepID=D4DNR7_NEIEG|nr:hypothetical protein NEIELOOT_00701 [Neisseria elongata subsp. glycolytica ATCC 29315]
MDSSCRKPKLRCAHDNMNLHEMAKIKVRGFPRHRKYYFRRPLQQLLIRLEAV